MRVFSKATSNRSQERGAVLILTALVILLLLSIAAFATDLAAWYQQGQMQQREADVASLNGVETYNGVVHLEFDNAGVNAWDQLSASDAVVIETAAMEAAIDALTLLLEASGLEFTNPAVYVIAPPPGGTSTATLTSDDGTIVTITRSPDSEMTVSISAAGTQYFSSLFRDAPEIVRSSTSQLSNCGAECNIPIVLNPPFAGFQATGQGDGYGPLLYGDEEVWAVNHHNRGSEGDIICMDRDTEAACKADGTQFPLGDRLTGNRPVEYIDVPNSKIYFASADQTALRSGLACFDVAARAWCGTQFVELFDFGGHSWPNTINVTGPWEYNNQLYVFAQNGELACVNKDMTTCGTWQTASFGGPDTPTLLGGNHIVHGEQLGSKIYFSQDSGAGQIFHCWDFATATSCWTGTQLAAYLGTGGDDHLTHFRYDTAGTVNGICTTDIIQLRNACVNLAGTTITEIAALNTHLGPLSANWGGDTITWENKHTFFAGGNSDQLACWSWETNTGCGLIDASVLVDGGPQVSPYGFSQISAKCIIGLGHRSIFFSFNPVGMGPCVDTKVETTIYPCVCADSSNRWGEVQLSSELMAMVDTLLATVTAPDGTVLLNQVDLVASNGFLDLTGVDQSITHLQLLLEVDSKLDVNGDPMWTDPIVSELELVVQPTLIG